MRLYKGMNVNPLNEAILSSAESILRSGYKLAGAYTRSRYSSTELNLSTSRTYPWIKLGCTVDR